MNTMPAQQNGVEFQASLHLDANAVLLLGSLSSGIEQAITNKKKGGGTKALPDRWFYRVTGEITAYKRKKRRPAIIAERPYLKPLPQSQI